MFFENLQLSYVLKLANHIRYDILPTKEAEIERPVKPVREMPESDRQYFLAELGKIGTRRRSQSRIPTNKNLSDILLDQFELVDKLTARPKQIRDQGVDSPRTRRRS